MYFLLFVFFATLFHVLLFSLLADVRYGACDPEDDRWMHIISVFFFLLFRLHRRTSAFQRRRPPPPPPRVLVVFSHIFACFVNLFTLRSFVDMCLCNFTAL
jgi:hypothetical protein